MQKMVGVINDNLKSVINGIRTHRDDTEKKLNAINAKIDEKIKEASRHKTDVDASRALITSFENEIASLEKDLKELTERFADKNFVGILDAANKEINTRIIEKRAQINRYTDNIKLINNKARDLKEELTALKAKRNSVEKALKNAEVLYAFFQSKIQEIIDFSYKNADSLDRYVVIKKDNNEVEPDIATLSQVDGSIFAEIDAISDLDPSIEEAERLLSKPDFIQVADESIEKKLSANEELDDIILEANRIITETEKKNKLGTSLNVDEIDEASEDDGSEDIKVLELEPQQEVEEEKVEEHEEELEVFSDDDFIPNDLLNGPLVVSPVTNVSVPTPIIMDSALDKKEEPNGEEVTITEEKVDNVAVDEPAEIEEHDEYVLEEKAEDEPVKEEVVQDEKVDEDSTMELSLDYTEDDLDYTNVINTVFSTDDLELSDQSLNVLNGAIANVSEQEKSPELLEDQLRECGLDPNRFLTSNLDKLQESFNKDNTKRMIGVLEKHNIDVDYLYNAVNVLINVTPQNLDKILSLLLSTGATNETIGFVFNMFDKINLASLEKTVSEKGKDEISNILYDCIPYFGDGDLISRLKLTKSEEYTLKDKTTNDEYKRMNMFQDIVFANYVVLRDLEISNLKECIVKHPRRFLMNPDKFRAILDKYDTEDLIRCINKNSAVIDKL